MRQALILLMVTAFLGGLCGCVGNGGYGGGGQDSPVLFGSTTTTNLSLWKGVKGDANWHTDLNSNADIIDTAVGIKLNADGSWKDAGAIVGLEKSADPTQPTEGQYVLWMSDGTGYGDDGDVCIAATAGAVTTKAILFDKSAGTAW